MPLCIRITTVYIAVHAVNTKSFGIYLLCWSENLLNKLFSEVWCGGYIEQSFTVL